MSTTLFLVIGRTEDGKVIHRLGGGSSTPSAPRVYESRVKAEKQLPFLHPRYGPKVKLEIVEVEV